MPNILTDTLQFGEGPAFDLNGDLWCTEIEGGSLVRRTHSGLERLDSPGNPSAIAFDDQNRALVCDCGHNAVRRFDPADQTWKTVADVIGSDRLAAPNDLAFGPDGSLVFTCPGGSRYLPVGYVCCLQPDGTLTKVDEGYYFPNGLAFTPDGGELIVSETTSHTLWRGEWDSDEFCWRNPQQWCEIGGPVGPDGMAFDARGHLYVAVFGSRSVRVVDHSGTVIDAIPVPGRDPTNVAFDGDGDLGMVVTESADGYLLSYPEKGPGASPFTGSSDEWR